MRPEIHARFTDEMLAELAARFGVDSKSLEKLDGFESFIYRYEKEGRGYILRVGHSGRRDESLVRGEIDWINYLASGGAAVSSAILSVNNNLVEVISDLHDERFVSVSFNEAPGKQPDKTRWNESLYENYGQAIGRMHALTSRYSPSDKDGYRPQWYDPQINDIEDVLAAADPVASEKWQGFLAAARALPVSQDAYGLIHYDAHGGNFFVDDEDQLTFFDFDDCNYNWFAADIAIVLFYKVMWAEDRIAASQEFLTPFMRGYRREYDLSSFWLAKIPLFLKIRELDLYGVIHRDFDLDTEEDLWIVGYMKGRHESIYNDLPYVDMDFSDI